MGYGDDEFLVTFQSRFGKEEWLRPYTDETVADLAKGGTRNMVVITPGFSADCVETLEEIAMQAKETFEENGGENFSVVPCLNDTDASISMLEGLVRRELQGWISLSERR